LGNILCLFVPKYVLVPKEPYDADNDRGINCKLLHLMEKETKIFRAGVLVTKNRIKNEKYGASGILKLFFAQEKALKQENNKK
jgi:hypothetical protein